MVQVLAPFASDEGTHPRGLGVSGFEVSDYF
jgi:hypothetical protein